MVKIIVVFVSFLLLQTLAIADEQNIDTGPSNPLSFLGDMFSQKSAALNKLIEDKKLKEADDYLASEMKYFSDNRKAQLVLLTKLATELNAIYEPQLGAAEENVLNTADYSQDGQGEIKNIIENVESLLSEYNSFEILKDDEFRSTKAGALKNALDQLGAKLVEAAPSAFLQFDHFSDKDFFAAYPSRLDSTAFFENNIEAFRVFINGLNSNQIATLKKKYSVFISDDGRFNEFLSSRYYSSTLATEKPPYSIGKIFNTLSKSHEAGFNPKLPDVKIAFVEATSKTLLNEGQIEFPAQVEMDIPLEPVKAELDEIFNNNEKADADYIIIFDVAAGKVARRIIAKNDADSKYISGTRNEPNPAYEVARGKLFEAQAGHSRAEAQYANGLAAGILKGIVVAGWSARVTEAETTLTQTSPTSTKDIFETYKYTVVSG